MDKSTIQEKKLLANRWILKMILNLWTIIAMLLFSLDFLSGNKFDSSASAIGVIYLAILGIYAGEKEYSRWKSKFISNFIGETFVVIWTGLMAFFVIAAPLSSGMYKIPPEFAIVYTSVIGVFALTRHSKALKSRK